MDITNSGFITGIIAICGVVFTTGFHMARHRTLEERMTDFESRANRMAENQRNTDAKLGEHSTSIEVLRTQLVSIKETASRSEGKIDSLISMLSHQAH